MNVVDVYLTYRSWCPGQSKCTSKQFLRLLADGLLNNTIGCAPDVPVLHLRVTIVEGAKGVQTVVHVMKSLKTVTYFIGSKVETESEDLKPPQTVLKCRQCHKNCSTFCKNMF